MMKDFGLTTPRHCAWVPTPGTPGAPYGDCVTELRRVELNMKLRRLHVQHQLLPHERLLSLSVFPLMGVGAFTDPAYSPQGPVAQSLFTPDEVIFQHKRFPCVPRITPAPLLALLIPSLLLRSLSLFSPFIISSYFNYFNVLKKIFFLKSVDGPCSVLEPNCFY